MPANDDRSLTPNLATVPLREVQAIETTRFPDRHFCQRGYDKAKTRTMAEAESDQCTGRLP